MAALKSSHLTPDTGKCASCATAGALPGGDTMAMKYCPVCGWKYSDTYRECPFCKEDDDAEQETRLRERTLAKASSRVQQTVSPDRGYTDPFDPRDGRLPAFLAA